MLEQHRHWLVKYFMIYWLYENNKFELISSFESDNYFLKREVNSFKYRNAKDSTYLEIFIKSLLKDKDCLVALQGIYLFPLMPEPNEPDLFEYNEYIRHISFEDKVDYIKHTLKSEFLIPAPDCFFNDKIWTDREIYKELNLSFRFFFKYKIIDPSKSLLNLNLFNNLIYDKMCEILKISKPSKEYGVNFDSGCIVEHFPIANRYFTEINAHRNQRTEAHPYDKHGNLRIRINDKELEKLIQKQNKALEEICRFDFLTYL